MNAKTYYIGQEVIISGRAPAPTRRDQFGKTQPLFRGVIREIISPPLTLSVMFEHHQFEVACAPEEVKGGN